MAPKKHSSKSAPKIRAVTLPSDLNFRRVLVPIDFSETSVQAFKCALGFAQKLGATLYLLHVYEAPSFMAGYPTLPTMVKVSDDEVLQKLRISLDALIPPDLSVKVQSFVRKGKPYIEIPKLAEEQNIDLIIISTHGYTGLKHTLLGSTTERVVQHAPCPVLVVR